MSFPGSCTQCRRRWDSASAAHCSQCHRQFSTVKNFDAHVPSRRGCKDPATLTRTKQDGTVVPLLKVVERSDGPVWVATNEPAEVAS